MCMCVSHNMYTFACIGFKFYGYIFVFCLFFRLVRSFTNKNANMGKITFQINQVFAWILQHSHWRRGKSINLFSFWSNRNSMLSSLSLSVCVPFILHSIQQQLLAWRAKTKKKRQANCTAIFVIIILIFLFVTVNCHRSIDSRKIIN